MTSDQRRNKRRQIRYGARIEPTDGSGQMECVIKDVSQSGARVNMTDLDRLPDDFILRFTTKETPQRCCHVVWRSKKEAGVMFVKETVRYDDFGRRIPTK